MVSAAVLGLLAVCPMLSFAQDGQITINVSTDGNTQYNVEHSGEHNGIINDVEIRMFHLTQEVLLDAARRFFGGRPIIVYFHDPAGRHNRYAQWSLRPVTVRSKIIRTRVNTDTVTSASLVRQVFINDHPNLTATYSLSMETSVEQSVVSSWSNVREVNIDKRINYVFKFGSGSASFSMTRSFGETLNITNTQYLSVEDRAEFSLLPGDSAVLTMTATRRALELDVDFESDLFGVSLTWYRLIRYGKQWWDHQIRSMLNAAHVPVVRYPTEIIHIGYFDGGRTFMDVYDRSGNKVRTEEFPTILSDKPLKVPDSKSTCTLR